MREPKLLKVYFYYKFGIEGEHKATEEDLKSAVETQDKKGWITGVFTEVPADWSDIHDFNNTTTNKQYWFTKVHAVYEGGHTLDAWADLNSEDDKCWMGYSDYGNLSDMLGEYAYDLPGIADD